MEKVGAILTAVAVILLPFSALASSPIVFSNSTGDSWNIGYFVDSSTGTARYMEQSFTAPENMKATILTENVSKSSSNTSAYVELYAGVSDHATGSILDTSNTQNITSGSMTAVTWTFSGGVTLTSGNQYVLRFKVPNEAIDSSYRITYYTAGSSTYAGGKAYNHKGNDTYSDLGEDLYGQLAYTTPLTSVLTPAGVGGAMVRPALTQASTGGGAILAGALVIILGLILLKFGLKRAKKVVH